MLEEIAPEVSVEELRALTEARFEVGRNLKPMAV